MAAKGRVNLQDSSAWLCRSIDCFEKLEQIGQGTHGQVYMAREIKTGEIVALKKLRMGNEKEGIPMSALREIKILEKLRHENVIKLKEVVTSQGPRVDETGKPDGNEFIDNIYMVFEYMDHDLSGLVERPGLRFTIPQIKCYVRQLLTGLHYCHSNQILHRDIKGSNLLINNDGILKLADFGLARLYPENENEDLTNRVITLRYRPPELLLGVKKYGRAVDMWSVGCIFAELLHGKPILPGKNEPEQLNKIFELCGAPDEINWPGVSKTPFYYKFRPTRPMKRRVSEVFQHFDRHALDLLEKMLTLDPSQRISARDALDAEYFRTDPFPCDPQSLPKYESSHKFQIRLKRQQQQQNEEMAKKLKLQHPPTPARLPPIQQPGQAHPPPWIVPNYPMNPFRPPVPAGPSHHHHHGNPPGPPRGPTSYHPSGNPSGGYYPVHPGQGQGYIGWQFPPVWQGPPYPMTNMLATGSQGPTGGYGVDYGPQYPASNMPPTGPWGPALGYGVGPPNYPQRGQYQGSMDGRGQKPRSSNQNQQYGRGQNPRSSNQNQQYGRKQ